MKDDSFARNLAGELARPGCAPEDALKWILQSEYGPRHLISDAQKDLLCLHEERREAERSEGPLWTMMGDGMARLSLAALPGGEAAERLAFRLFAHAAADRRGKEEAREEKLALLLALTEAGKARFSPEELRRCLEDWRAAGCPAVRHSEGYHRANRPAYRVVGAEWAPLWPILLACEEKILEKGRVVLAVDGRCAAGKSTLSSKLAALFGGAEAHMDDFFLPPSRRTEERLAQPGGNVDWERFLREVARPLSLGKAAKYRPFDCKLGRQRGETVETAPVPAAIVEGCYCLRPELRSAYDLTVFLTVEEEIRRARLLRRNGKDAQLFFDRWIPLEERYFSAFRIYETADFILSGWGE